MSESYAEVFERTAEKRHGAARKYSDHLTSRWDELRDRIPHGSDKSVMVVIPEDSIGAVLDILARDHPDGTTVACVDEDKITIVDTGNITVSSIQDADKGDAPATTAGAADKLAAEAQRLGMYD